MDIKSMLLTNHSIKLEDIKNKNNMTIGWEVLLDRDECQRNGISSAAMQSSLSSGTVLLEQLEELSNLTENAKSCIYEGKKFFLNVEESQLLDRHILKAMYKTSMQCNAVDVEIIFEITERHYGVDPKEVFKSIQDLSSLGVKFALDDYDGSLCGFRYAALVSGLVSFVKVDNLQVLNNLFELPKQCEVILEKVENLELLAAARNNNKVNLIQGYVFGKPGKFEHFNNSYSKKVSTSLGRVKTKLEKYQLLTKEETQFIMQIV